MWGAGRGLRNLVLATLMLLMALAFVLLALLFDRAQEWHMRDEPRRLPRNLAIPATPPRLIGNPAQFFGPDIYPAEAVRQNWDGRSGVALLVDEEGTPTACEVVESSGHAVLDEATCRIVVKNAHFEPARDRQGRAMVGVYGTFHVRWQLPQDR